MIPAPLDTPDSSPAALAAAVRAASRIPAPEAVRAALSDLHAPPEDFLSTLLSARIGLMAAAQGAAFVHHELRLRTPMPEALGPEIPVWDGQTVPQWHDGVLEAPKYFSFFLDAALPPYDPNHRRKWRPHEALHGLVSFFWRPELTRFEAYVGARLSELLPVTHWYGYDEIGRHRCPKHLGGLLYRVSCPDCEAIAARPYWTAPHDDAMLARQSLAAAERAAAYLSTELAAIDQERSTGRRVVTHHPRLDGSSDAEGYLRGHYSRLTAWSFGATVEHFLVADEDYEDTVEDLQDRLLSVRRQLLCAPLSLDPALAERRRTRRMLRDLGYRTFVALEWLDEGSPAEDTLMPAIDAAAELSSALLSGADPQAAIPLIGDWLDRLASCADQFPPEVAASFEGLAWGWWPTPRLIDAGLPQLTEGIASALPVHTPDPATVRAFARSAVFSSSGSLRRRYGPWCGDDRAWFSSWLHDLPHTDRDAELFATLPEDETEPLSPAALRLNQTLRRQVFPAALVALVLDEDAAGPPFLREDGCVEMAAVWWAGEPRIVPLDPGTAEAIAAIVAGEVLDREALKPLLESGVAVYLPPCT
jgi:hypothetical protein